MFCREEDGDWVAQTERLDSEESTDESDSEEYFLQEPGTSSVARASAREPTRRRSGLETMY